MYKYLDNFFKKGLFLSSFLLMSCDISHAFGALDAKRKVEEYQAKIKELETKVKEGQVKTAELQSKGITLENQVKQLQPYQAEAVKLKDVVKQNQTKIAELENQGKHHQQKSTELQSKAIALENQVKQIQPYQAEAVKLKDVVKQNQTKIEELEAQGKQHQQKSTELQSKTVELENQVKQMQPCQGVATALENQVKEHQKKVEALEIQLKETQKGTEKPDPQEVTVLKQEIEGLQNKLIRYEPAVIAHIVELPPYSDLKGYIHDTPFVSISQELTSSVTTEKSNVIRYIGLIESDVDTLNLKGIEKRQIKKILNDTKEAINVSNEKINWADLKESKKTIDNNDSYFDKIPQGNKNLEGLKKALEKLENIGNQFSQATFQNQFKEVQDKILSLSKNTSALDGLANSFLIKHIPQFTESIRLFTNPTAQQKGREIIEKMQKGEFDDLRNQLTNENVKPYGALGPWINDEFRRAGKLKVFEDYQDDIQSYMKEIDRLDALNQVRQSVKDLHLIGHGTKRFNTAFSNLKGKSITNTSNNPILQEILKISNPLSLEGAKRRSFVAGITKLSREQDPKLEPVTKEIRELTGGYFQIQRASALLYTKDNPPQT